LDLFNEIAPDKIGESLKNNIVGGIMIISLLFWIPFSCFINFVDKKRMQHQQEEEERFYSSLPPPSYFSSFHENRHVIGSFRDNRAYSRGGNNRRLRTRYGNFNTETIQEHDPMLESMLQSSSDDDDVINFNVQPLPRQQAPVVANKFESKLMQLTPITWSDEDLVNDEEEKIEPIASDADPNLCSRKDLLRDRPPFVRAQALVISSPSSPKIFANSAVTSYLGVLHEEDVTPSSVVTSQRPSLKRQAATSEDNI